MRTFLNIANQFWLRVTLLMVLLCVGCFAAAGDHDIVVRASALAHSGKIRQAEALLGRAVAVNFVSAELQGALGRLLFDEQKYQEAVQQLNRATQLAPDSREYNMLL